MLTIASSEAARARARENEIMLIEKLKERFGAAISEAGTTHGQDYIVVARERALEILRALATESGFEFNSLSDLTAVDWPERTPRFEVVYNLNSLTRTHRLRVKAPVPATMRRFPASSPYGRRRIGWSASATTCSASCSVGILTCAASCSMTPSRGIRCARITRTASVSRSCPRSMRS